MRHLEFLSDVLLRGIAQHASVWAEALRLNFNVVVCCENIELSQIVLNALSRPALLRSLGSVTVHDLDHRPAEGQEQFSKLELSAERAHGERRSPVLYICSRSVPHGLIAVRFDLPSIRSLLPGVGVLVGRTLEHLSLERYTDCFDGKTMSILKRILETHGVIQLLDAIIQVAYLGGVLGDETRSRQYLESAAQEISVTGQGGASTNTGLNLETLLDSFMATSDPYDTLKAVLAHHAFVRKKVTQAEASRNLRVSRSTLQSHLHMAERLNVARFFMASQSLG